MTAISRHWIELLIFSMIAQLLVWACFSHIFSQMELQGNWQYWIVALAIMLLVSAVLLYLRDLNLQLLAMIFLASLSAGSLLHATGYYANAIFNLPMWMRTLTVMLTGMLLLLIFVKARKQHSMWSMVVIVINFLFAGINWFCDYNLVNLIKGLL